MIDGLLRRQMRSAPPIGWFASIGLLLLVTSAVLWFSTLAPMRREVAELRDEVVRLEAVARQGPRGPGTLATQAAAFVRRLPSRGDLPDVLTQVVSHAKDAGLQLERGDYEFSLAKSGAIARYRMTLPVSGTYVQVHEFVDGTLAALPPVALEGLKIERDSVDVERLQADLRFAVMVRSE